MKMKRCISLIMAALLVLSCLPATALASKSLEYEKTVVLDETTNLMHKGLQEQLVTVGDYQYTAYYDLDLKLVIARRNLINDEVQTIRFPDGVDQAGYDDGHYHLAVGYSQDGRFHVSYNNRNNRNHYRVSDADWTTNPPETISIDQFSDDIDMIDENYEFGERRTTYPLFFNDNDGDLYFSFRSASVSFLKISI